MKELSHEEENTKRDILETLDYELEFLEFVMKRGHKTGELETPSLLIGFDFDTSTISGDKQMIDIRVDFLENDPSEMVVYKDSLSDHHVVTFLEFAGYEQYAEDMGVEIFTGS